MSVSEVSAFGRAWWCRGGGAAVVALLVAVAVFRAPRDVLFWIAIGFFVGHLILAVFRYARSRRYRATVEVSHRHDLSQVISPPPSTVPHPGYLSDHYQAVLYQLHKKL